MAIDMSESELERHVGDSAEVDWYEYVNAESEDDYVRAVLCKTRGGRHFRYVAGSGYDSTYAGAQGWGEWLDDDEVAQWTNVYPGHD